jgi:hypothetical protein
MPPQNKPRLSLFELALVVAVLVFIGASAGVAALPRCIPSKIHQARSDLAILESAANMMAAETGDKLESCPTLDTLVEAGLLSGTRMDPWNRPYVIICDTSEIRALSAGPDGELGTRDDP